MNEFKFMVGGLITSLVISVVPVSAQQTPPPRLALWATESISISISNRDICALPQDASQEAAALVARTTLTEEDIGSWNAVYGHQSLAPRRFPAFTATALLRDHCFVLAIDGEVRVRGIALGSESTCSTGLPTLSVYSNGGDPYLQLSSAHCGKDPRGMPADDLDAIFGKRANMVLQLLRLAQDSDPDRMLRLGEEWVSAVRQLIEQKKIRLWTSLKEVSALLGEPSVVPQGLSGRYSWYFNTPRQVNPAFDVDARDDVVQSFRLQSR